MHVLFLDGTIDKWFVRCRTSALRILRMDELSHVSCIRSLESRLYLYMFSQFANTNYFLVLFRFFCGDIHSFFVNPF